MPGIDGLETAKEIRKLNRDMLIIFLTAYSEFVFESFKVDAFRYLVKPVPNQGTDRDTGCYPGKAMCTGRKSELSVPEREVQHPLLRYYLH